MIEQIAATPFHFKSGHRMKNRFTLAPLTNMQSHADGSLSDAEYTWLTMRARGGFAATMTCAAAVNLEGKAWPGELCLFEDAFDSGLRRLSGGIKAHDSISLTQIFHGGFRADPEVSSKPRVSSSDSIKYNARALTLAEVEATIEDFIAAAVRCQKAGFDGVEIHGAHGYLVAQFLSPTINQRSDAYGGSLDNRARFLRDIIAGIRARCGPKFCLGLRLSAERFGMTMADILPLCEQLMAEDKLDFIDISLWDCFKKPEETDYASKPLIDWYTAIDRGNTALGVCGQLRMPDDVARALNSGADFVLLGRAAIINHDFPAQMLQNPSFTPNTLPVAANILAKEGLSPPFIDYMRSWDGFVAD